MNTAAKLGGFTLAAVLLFGGALFLDVSHGGVVHTAEFTVPTGLAAAGGGAHHEGGHG